MIWETSSRFCPGLYISPTILIKKDLQPIEEQNSGMLLPKKDAQYRQTMLREKDKCVYVRNACYKLWQMKLSDRRNLIARKIKQNNDISMLFDSNYSILKTTSQNTKVLIAITK